MNHGRGGALGLSRLLSFESGLFAGFDIPPYDILAGYMEMTEVAYVIGTHWVSR